MRRDPAPHSGLERSPLRPGGAGWPRRRRQRLRGLALVTVLFLMLVLGMLAAAMIVIAPVQQTSAALDQRGAQAYQAATAALEWGTYQVLRSKNCPASTTLQLGGGMGGYTAVVQCSKIPTDDVQENGASQVGLYVVTATAHSGAAGAGDYVERQVQATLSQCTRPLSPDPAAVC